MQVYVLRIEWEENMLKHYNHMFTVNDEQEGQQTKEHENNEKRRDNIIILIKTNLRFIHIYN